MIALHTSSLHKYGLNRIFEFVSIRPESDRGNTVASEREPTNTHLHNSQYILKKDE